MESALERLYTLTLSLKQQVVEHDGEANDTLGNWLILLDERQQIIDQLSMSLDHGETISHDQRKMYIEKVRDLDQQILPIIREKMGEIQSKLHSINKSKLANQQYNSFGQITPYGAFFDKKK